MQQQRPSTVKNTLKNKPWILGRGGASWSTCQLSGAWLWEWACHKSLDGIEGQIIFLLQREQKENLDTRAETLVSQGESRRLPHIQRWDTGVGIQVSRVSFQLTQILSVGGAAAAISRLPCLVGGGGWAWLDFVLQEDSFPSCLFSWERCWSVSAWGLEHLSSGTVCYVCFLERRLMNCHSAGILGASPVSQKDLMGPRAISGGEERQEQWMHSDILSGIPCSFSFHTRNSPSITILN